MCRALNALIQSIICLLQVTIRIFMTVLLMAENLVKMILQTVYNFISFLLQMLSLVPICLVFFVTSKLKCLLCGSGGGICPVNRGSGDCIMTGLAFALLFFIFRWTGFLDKIFYNIGYARIAKGKPEYQGLREGKEGIDGLRSGNLVTDAYDDSGTGVLFLNDHNLLREYEETETTEATETTRGTKSLPTRTSPFPRTTTRSEITTETVAKNLTTVMYYLV